MQNRKHLYLYTSDTLSISKTGQEIFKHLSSVSSMDYVNRFENEVTEVFAKEDTTQGVKSDTFEHHVNRMAEAYNKIKNSIEEKYAEQDWILDRLVLIVGRSIVVRHTENLVWAEHLDKYDDGQ